MLPARKEENFLDFASSPDQAVITLDRATIENC